jgi:carboxymethylenebutenolidase
MDGHIWSPDGGEGAGILLLQEIFGVSTYIRGVAERLCALGYTVLAPDLFWRIERNVELEHDDAGFGRGLELGGQLDVPLAIADCGAALEHLRALPETKGRAGVLGFCLGGTLAFATAVQFSPDAAVSYYGSGVPDMLDQVGEIECPILFHFGRQDAYIPVEQAQRVREALEGIGSADVRLHEAGHAFDNFDAPIFYDADVAREAWEITVEFLERELPQKN